MSLIRFLKENENARKIFGKRELKIIEKQLLGINLTQSEKNRLSRDIRKKFQFIKEISGRTYDFDLKKGSLIKEKIQNAIEVIKKSKDFPKIKKIILFGSTAENQRSFRSDIDIAVEFDEITSREAALFRIKTSGKLSDDIDIRVYNILPDKIKKEIDEKSKILWQRYSERHKSFPIYPTTNCGNINVVGYNKR